RTRRRRRALGPLGARRAHRLHVDGGLGEALGAGQHGGSGVGVSAPPGYTTVAAARVRAAIRLDLASQLAPWLLAARLEIPADAERVGAGRGATWRTIAPDGSRVVVRICHRGGVVGRFV